MKRSTCVLGFTATFLLVAFVTSGAAYAVDESATRSLFNPNKIIGLWDVEVVLTNCNTGEPTGSFQAMHQFHLGGTGQVVPAGNPSALSAHLVVWSHIRRNNFQQTLKFYRFDATGAVVGFNVIRNQITLNQAGDEFVGSGVADFYTVAGDFMFSVCPSIIGTRFTGQE